MVEVGVRWWCGCQVVEEGVRWWKWVSGGGGGGEYQVVEVVVGVRWWWRWVSSGGRGGC